MKTWQKILIPTLISLAIGGIYLFSVWKQRQNPGIIGQPDASQSLSKDDLAVVRAFSPAHFDDLQRLEDTRVWMKDGYATPVGAIQGDAEAYFTDLLFYYDDPHAIHGNWPKDVWSAIDAHQVKPGMSELETRMAIGQKIKPDGQTEGDGTVAYDQDGKHWTVTYVKNRATVIKNN